VEISLALIPLLAVAAIGTAAGAVVAWLILRARRAALAERLRAAEAAALEAVVLRQKLQEAEVRLAEAGKDLESARERSAWLDEAEAKLKDAFGSLAARALKDNSEQVMRNARGQVVDPLLESLKRLDDGVRDIEKKRAEAYGQLSTQLGELQRANTSLNAATTGLASAMKSTGARGRWGELQLRRVVEFAGMIDHVNFAEQASQGEGRPDMVVNIPGGGTLPVDAKAPMDAYFEGTAAQDEKTRGEKFAAHAEALKRHIKALGDREYWKQAGKSPEVTVMFIPVEACLGAALEAKPELMEYAMELRVLLATPVTMLGVLKAVAYGWQQAKMTENVRALQEQCREFYERLDGFIGRLSDVGRNLDRAVEAYNAGIGSLESRLMPSVRRLREMGTGTGEITAPRTVEKRARLPEPPEGKPGA
jgi:DNA recombination protein RmuC